MSAAGRFGNPLPRGERPAVVVVDLTLGFTDPGSPLGADLGGAVTAAGHVIAAARQAGAPVFFTSLEFSADLEDIGVWAHKVPALADLRRGGRWVELDPRLDRQEGEPWVAKQGASGVHGTDLARLLVERRVDTVILCGASTSGCVRATAVDLVQLGYPTLVPREAVGDRSRPQHEASLVDIDLKYGDVIGVEDAISYLGSLPGRSKPTSKAGAIRC